MKRNKVLSRILPVIFISSSLCMASLIGCDILPTEDARCVFPTAAEQETPEYNMVTVTRTDIIHTETIMCIYSGGDDMLDLSFNRGGLPIKEVHVKKGNIVSEGDLLAELDTGDLQDRICDLEQTIAENEFYLSQENELKDIETAKVNAQYKYGLISASTRDLKLENIRKTYSKATHLEQTIYYDKLEYETLCEQLENSRIYAPAGGLISYIDSSLDDPEQASIIGNAVIGLSEFSTCRFRASTKYRDYYKDGDIVSIEMMRGGTGTYDAIIEFDPNDNTIMYLYPTENIIDLDYGARANLTLILDDRQDVLAVNSAAVRKGEGFEYVYCLNENGYRDIKIVETGAESNGGYIEIISGLEFGESIIQ